MAVGIGRASTQVLCCASHTDAPGGTDLEREVADLRLPVFGREADGRRLAEGERVNPNKKTRWILQPQQINCTLFPSW